ncbi:hypothetical protein QCN29_25845 [Streptomyces sp. HNM0663]|uniref:Uncharacterized protein n=1 Tax=Streptomyces chengmaiensis TaxID=3040919 RepID=A0ABT6HTW7_9ACTN|nr:hypothetical protein [Streptomyces chengmaiensis]MDH2392145.1 hypothetical protein [Streptomyces chengmaiensis]
MASKATATDTDARQMEYSTYAPAGETCPACTKPIKPLEGCRRGMLTRPVMAPAVAYWHNECAPKGVA